MFALKFKIRNFGNIREAEIELKPLTVFMGFNNTGKTYLSYLLYDLLKSSPNISFNFDSNLQDKVIEGLVKNRSFTINLEEYLTKNRSKIEKRINDACKDFGNRVLNSNQSFKGAEFEIENIFSMRDDNKNTSTRAELYGRNIEAVFEGNVITIKTKRAITKRNLRKGSNAYKTFKNRLEDFLNFCVKSSLFPGEVFFLPAERATLIQMMGYLENFIFSYAFLGIPNGLKLPLPLVDFKHYFEFYASGKSFFEDVSNFLESEVLGGKVDIIQKSEPYSKKVVYKYKNYEIDITAASSGVKALSGLNVLLKKRLSKGDVLFIDEPEITLHPKNQIKLVEAFGMAVNKGLNTVMATHSPYIVDHINNLILGYEAVKKNRKGSLKVLEEYGIKENSLINPDSVAAYEFKENGEVVDVFNRDEGSIDWETFGEYSDKLSEIGYELKR